MSGESTRLDRLKELNVELEQQEIHSMGCRDILDALPVAVLVVEGGVVVFANLRAGKLARRSAGELVGLDVNGIAHEGRFISRLFPGDSRREIMVEVTEV